MGTMNLKFIRVYKKVDVDHIKEHLIICGDLSASCSKCNELSIKMDSPKCPSCQTDFLYMAFRNVKENMPKIHKFSETRPDLMLVDYEDFKRTSDAIKARGLLE